ncbi:MAG: 2-phosphoglycerate kinase [Actinomycetota bacterium]
MSPKRQTQHILVSDRAGLPFSKGLMASSLMATGLAPFRAYEVAEQIESRLLSAERYEITRAELIELASETIFEMVGQRYAETYRNWQRVEELELPFIVLIGGTTGTGKSTIATQLAARLGITRIISTDAIREVMRSLFSERIMPALHTSSFEASEAIRGPIPKSADPVIVGFEQQVRAVSVAVEALIDRAVLEGTDLIIEGAHLVPGFIDSPEWSPPWEDKAVVVPIVITVDDEDVHRSHFFLREMEAGQRNVERYLSHFENIRKIQKFIRTQAEQRGVPVIASYSLDSTLTAVIDHLVEKAVERFGGRADPGEKAKSEVKVKVKQEDR